MLKQTIIGIATGALMLSSAAGVFAYGHHHSSSSIEDSYNTTNETITKTVTVHKANVDNFAIVHNDVTTLSNSGLNFMMVPGGDTSTGPSTGEKEGRGGMSTVNGGSATGGNTTGTIVTGDAGATSTVSNVVNTTLVRF